MIINAILLTIGLVGIPAAICANTELTCGAAASGGTHYDNLSSVCWIIRFESSRYLL